MAAGIETKDVLEWCFVIASLDLGVLGFLYSAYVSARIPYPVPPKIAYFLKGICRAITAVLFVLTSLAVFTSYQAKVDFSVWVIVGCLISTTFFSILLVYNMD